VRQTLAKLVHIELELFAFEMWTVSKITPAHCTERNVRDKAEVLNAMKENVA